MDHDAFNEHRSSPLSVGVKRSLQECLECSESGLTIGEEESRIWRRRSGNAACPIVLLGVRKQYDLQLQKAAWQFWKREARRRNHLPQD